MQTQPGISLFNLLSWDLNVEFLNLYCPISLSLLVSLTWELFFDADDEEEDQGCYILKTNTVLVWSYASADSEKWSRLSIFIPSCIS